MAAPQLYQLKEKIDLSIFSKQELSASDFSIATAFRWESKKVDINFSTEIFFKRKIASAIGERREWKSGLSEVTKSHLKGDDDIEF